MLAEDTSVLQKQKIAVLQGREPPATIKKEDNPPKIMWGDWKKNPKGF